MQPALGKKACTGVQVLIFIISFLKFWITELVSMKVDMMHANT